MKMHRSLQPHLLEKYYLEVLLSRSKICSRALLFLFPSNSPQRGRTRALAALTGCGMTESLRKPNPTLHRRHEEAGRSPACPFPPQLSGAGTAGERTRQNPSAVAAASGLPVELAFHLFFTNFFLEALGFNRLLPAPKVLSRTCSIAERLEMSFSAKGDAPAT